MEVETDLKFQRRVWRAQRIGWLVIGAAILAALLGLFGTGPLSRASTDGGGLRVEYDRFARREQPMRLRLVLPESKLDAQVSLARDYLEGLRVEQVVPEPKEVEVVGRWLVYHFSGPGPLAVTFDVQPIAFGRLAGLAEISPGEGVSFQQFIYP
jgi:hypothetical protein